MATLRLALDDTGLRNGILLCITFIGLNILDAWLTGVALGAGSYELNPFLGAKFGSSILVKGLIACIIVTALVLFKRGGLLKALSLGMLLICVWDGIAIWSWS
jgi:hypothetical protein